jgi:hypothetical protein
MLGRSFSSRNVADNTKDLDTRLHLQELQCQPQIREFFQFPAFWIVRPLASSNSNRSCIFIFEYTDLKGDAAAIEPGVRRR